MPCSVSALIHLLNEIHTLSFLLKDTAVEKTRPRDVVTKRNVILKMEDV